MEAQLIKTCQQGQLEDFAQLYDTYSKSIYQFIYYKTHHRETAEDLTSITFMKALNALDSFEEDKGSFKTWLYQIARNTVIDHYRANKTTEDLEDAWDLKDETDIERDANFLLKIEAVQKYMKKLKPDQREVVLLRVWGDRNFKEIAQIMGKSEAACKMLFKRIIEKLRDDFAPFMTLLLLIK